MKHKEIRFRLVAKSLILVGVLFIMVTLPLTLSTYWLVFFFFFFAYAAISEIFNFLSEYSGMVCLGLHGFVGLGGYTLAVFSTLWGLPIWISIFLSGIMCTCLALATSYLIIRMKGLYFSLSTMVVAWVLFYAFQSWPYVGAGYGMFLSVYTGPLGLYYASLIFLSVSIFIIKAFMRSKVGLRLSAIKDDETAANCCGINIFRTRVYCWVVSSFIVGLVGGLYFIYSGFISPTAAFAFHWTQAAITGTIIGGRRTIEGPIIGSLIVVILRQFFLVMFPGLSMLLYGVLIIATLLIFPEGIIGFITRVGVHTKLFKRQTSKSEQCSENTLLTGG